MKIIYYCVAAVCVLVSLSALIHALYWQNMSPFFLFAINGAMVAVIWWLSAVAKLPVVSALLYMAFLWPGIGPLLLCWAMYWNRHRASESEQLREYQKYIEALKLAQGLRPLSAGDVQTDINTLTGRDVMHLTSPTRKKDFIIGSKEQDLPHQVAVLSKALRDSDPEVRHYAAAMMAALSDGCENEIQGLKEKAGRDPELLLPLIDAYDRYIHSGLMAFAVRREFAKEYLSLLWEGKKLWPQNYEVALKLLNTLVEQAKYDEARQVLPEIATSFPLQPFPLLVQMRLEFLQGNFKQVAEVASKIREAGWSVPRDYQPMVEYWLGEGKTWK